MLLKCVPNVAKFRLRQRLGSYCRVSAEDKAQEWNASIGHRDFTAKPGAAILEHVEHHLQNGRGERRPKNKNGKHWEHRTQVSAHRPGQICQIPNLDPDGPPEGEGTDAQNTSSRTRKPPNLLVTAYGFVVSGWFTCKLPRTATVCEARKWILARLVPGLSAKLRSQSGSKSRAMAPK